MANVISFMAPHKVSVRHSHAGLRSGPIEGADRLVRRQIASIMQLGESATVQRDRPLATIGQHNAGDRTRVRRRGRLKADSHGLVAAALANQGSAEVALWVYLTLNHHGAGERVETKSLFANCHQTARSL